MSDFADLGTDEDPLYINPACVEAVFTESTGARTVVRVTSGQCYSIERPIQQVLARLLDLPEVPNGD